MDKLSKTWQIIIVSFVGYLGVHYFLSKNLKRGLLYLFTAGGLGFGWLYDIYRAAVGRGSEFSGGFAGKIGTLKHEPFMAELRSGRLPDIRETGLRLLSGERCVYYDKAYTTHTQIVTTGYKHSTGGIGFKVSQNVMVGGTSGESKAVRQRQNTYYPGKLYLTTQRIVYTSTDQSIAEPLDRIVAVEKSPSGLLLQVDQAVYALSLQTADEFLRALKLLGML